VPLSTEPADLDLDEVDLTDTRTFHDLDLPSLWRRFRAEKPLHWHRPTEQGPGFWVVSRYADVVDVYRDDQRFTSERGNVLATLLHGHDSASRKMLAVMDGPRHRELRNLMLRSFTPRALAPVVEGVRRRTDALVRAALEIGEVDFVTDVADHIPINTIGDLMDIPAADRAQLVAWNTLTLSRHQDETEADERTARNEILRYFSELAGHRRKHPGDDLISVLATATVDGEALTEEEIVLNCYSLIIGGDESSRMSSTGGLIALAEHPQQWQALKEGSVTLDSASEEVLRWSTPAMHFGRRALVDVPMGDQMLMAGDVVTLWNSSANFDETVFADPHRFDLARTPNRHVAFGHGPHFCLGAYLGRLHVSAMMESLRSSVSAISLLSPPERLHSNFVQGYSHLRVSLAPTRTADGAAVG